MKKLLVSLIALMSVVPGLEAIYGRKGQRHQAAYAAPAPVAPTPAPAPVAPANPLAAVIAAALANIAKAATSTDAVRLQNLDEAVKALKAGLGSIAIKDLLPSQKSELTDVCDKMRTEADSLLAFYTAGDWMPYLIKSPKSQVLKVHEILAEITVADQLINGKRLKTYAKQAKNWVLNHKLKTVGYVALVLAARKAGVFDLGYDGVKSVVSLSFDLANRFFWGEKYDLKGTLKNLPKQSETVAKFVAKAAKQTSVQA